jgi:nucleoside-diphosphate-sugar epimerase
MSQKTIAIIGFGWLGKPLAIQLKECGYRVLAGSRNDNKVKEINDLGILGFKLSFTENTMDSDLSDDQINQCDYLIISVPPSGFENYAGSLENLVKAFSAQTRIIFTSSTGVYKDIDAEIDETSEIIENHPVYVAEKTLQSIAKDCLTILRLAGLIGENRHPAKFFVQRNSIPNGASPVNLVRREDVINSILIVLKKNRFGETYNIVNPQHPAKGSYYFQAAKALFGKEIDRVAGEKGKLVNGIKFMNQFDFAYEHSISDWDAFKGSAKLT